MNVRILSFILQHPEPLLPKQTHPPYEAESSRVEKRDNTASAGEVYIRGQLQYIFNRCCSIYPTAHAVYIFVFREYIWGEQIHIILLSGKPAMAGHLSKLRNCFETVLKLF